MKINTKMLQQLYIYIARTSCCIDMLVLVLWLSIFPLFPVSYAIDDRRSVSNITELCTLNSCCTCSIAIQKSKAKRKKTVFCVIVQTWFQHVYRCIRTLTQWHHTNAIDPMCMKKFKWKIKQQHFFCCILSLTKEKRTTNLREPSPVELFIAKRSKKKSNSSENQFHSFVHSVRLCFHCFPLKWD